MTDVLTGAAQGETLKPEVKGGLVAYLQVDGATKAAAFYKKAFAAEEVAVHAPDEQGRTMHVHLYINGSSLMMSDAYPEHGMPLEKPGAFTMTLALRASNVDTWWERAVAAGCEVVLPLQLMFWGDRYGQVKDPFGVTWAFVAPPKAS